MQTRGPAPRHRARAVVVTPSAADAGDAAAGCAIRLRDSSNSMDSRSHRCAQVSRCACRISANRPWRPSQRWASAAGSRRRDIAPDEQGHDLFHRQRLTRCQVGDDFVTDLEVPLDEPIPSRHWSLVAPHGGPRRQGNGDAATVSSELSEAPNCPTAPAFPASRGDCWPSPGSARPARSGRCRRASSESRSSPTNPRRRSSSQGHRRGACASPRIGVGSPNWCGRPRRGSEPPCVSIAPRRSRVCR